MKTQTICRAVHNRDNPYLMLHRDTIWDTDLSLGALGLLTRALNHPDDWKFSIKNLTEKCQEGRTAIDSLMQELISHRYVVRLEATTRGSKGLFSQRFIEYVIFEVPVSEEEIFEMKEEFKKFHRDFSYRDLGCPDLGCPDLGKSPPLNSNITNPSSEEDGKKEKNNKRESSSAAPPPPSNALSRNEKIERAQHVSTTAAEHEKLIQEHGEKATTRFYQILSEWKLNTPRNKWKLNDYLSIRKWVVKAYQEENQQFMNKSHSSSHTKPSQSRVQKNRDGSDACPHLRDLF